MSRAERVRAMQDERESWGIARGSDRIMDAALTASDALLREPEAVERVADILAYQRCKSTNPKADHPIFGFHTFHPDQRAFLQEQQMGNARAVIAALLGEGE